MNTATVTSGPTFPIDWMSIKIDGEPFRFDPMHFPFPVSPLTASTSHAFAEGYTAAHQELNVPIDEMQVRYNNHYRYERMIWPQPASEEQAAAQGALVEATFEREMARMLDRWYGEHRPRIVACHERLRQMQPRGAMRDEILALLDEVDEIHRELWTIHFRIVGPMMLSMQLFTELHADLFGGSSADAHALMAGGTSESVKAGFGLFDLAVLARELGLVDLIMTTPDDALVAALETSLNGNAFLVNLHAYLEEYGLRLDLFDLATPTWQEDPSFALASMRNYLRTDHDPRAEHAAMVQSTQVAFDTARAKLAFFPVAVRERFEVFVQHARQGAFLQEEHNFYIDQRGLALLRYFYLDVGRHLCDLGTLAQPDDIFMLRIEEIRELLGVPASGQSDGRARVLVAERRDELERAASMVPPPILGDPAASPPARETPMGRAMMSFFGGPPQQTDVPGQLKGNPGSRGVASGVARVARTLDEAKDVQPGEVLIALTTMPAWTPLFGVAAAIVTETGGALSHCAIVAREYGIPAVVGVRGATDAIATGQQVTVDGEQGLVYLNA